MILHAGDATMRRHRRVRFRRGSMHRQRPDVRQHHREFQVRVPARVQAIREEELGFRMTIGLVLNHDSEIRFPILATQDSDLDSLVQ